MSYCRTVLWHVNGPLAVLLGQVTTWWQHHKSTSSEINFILSEDQKTRWAAWFNSSASHMHTITALRYAKTQFNLLPALCWNRSHISNMFWNTKTELIYYGTETTPHNTMKTWGRPFTLTAKKQRHAKRNLTNNSPALFVQLCMLTLINANLILFMLRE